MTDEELEELKTIADNKDPQDFEGNFEIIIGDEVWTKRDHETFSTKGKSFQEIKSFLESLPNSKGKGKGNANGLAFGKFFGGAGDDSLSGGAGNDTVNGEGSDTLFGGAGNDLI